MPRLRPIALFAAPLLGDLRRRPPRPAVKWGGVRQAAQFSAAGNQIEVRLAPHKPALDFFDAWPHFDHQGKWCDNCVSCR
jgi:hypothetical protein